MVSHRLAPSLLKWYLKRNKFNAWTSLWNTIYYVDEKSMMDSELVKHELVHIEQIKREGKIKFLFKYLYYNIRYGYWDNPYEVEARG